MNNKRNTEVDILYNLLTYINASYSQGIYYTICYQVLNNIEKIPNISINELADLCYTSPATISRFCKALKCDNFAEFKKEVESGIKQANHEIKLNSQNLGEIHNEPSKCIDMVYDLSINSLKESKQYVNIHEIDRLCDIIYNAKKLHFFGFQFNKILASDIQFKLVKLGKFSYAFADRGDDSQRIELLDKNSVAIVLSVRARMMPVGELIRSIKNRGAQVILITMNKQSEVIKLADRTFLIHGQESNFTESSLSGTTTMKTYLDLLYVRYGILYSRR